MPNENRNFYKFVADEYEIKWWFNHVVVKPEVNESYLICLSARNKKLSDEERKTYELGRSEMIHEVIITPRNKSKIWNYNIWASGIYKYECNTLGLLTKNGLPYPQKCLAIYSYLNPSDEVAVAESTADFTNTLRSELVRAAIKGSKDGILDNVEKLTTVMKHMKSCHANNLSRKIYIQFDFDINPDYKANRNIIYEGLYSSCISFFKKGNFFIIGTSGGFHIVVKKELLKFNPNLFIDSAVKSAADLYANNIAGIDKDYNYDTLYKKYMDTGKSPHTGIFEEAIRTPQEFIPLPGTYQYGSYIVRCLNKDDYN